MKMKRCLTLCGKAKYVKGKNGRPIVAARIGNVVGYLVLIRQHTLCLRLLSCEELTSFLDRVTLEEVRIGVDSRMIECIRVGKDNAETADLIYCGSVLSQSLKLDISGCSVLIDDRVKVFRNLEPHPHIIRIAEIGLSVKPWLTPGCRTLGRESMEICGIFSVNLLSDTVTSVKE